MIRPVVVVGDVCVDVVARPASGPDPDGPNPGGPNPGGLSGGLSAGSDTDAAIRIGGGGAGANVAAWLATLGVPVTMVARVGDDPAGRSQAAELGGYGVRCAFAVDREAPTGWSCRWSTPQTGPC